MRIFFENAYSQLTLLEHCIARDSSSLSGWSCLHIIRFFDATTLRSMLTRESIFSRLERQFDALDGTIIVSLDGDVLIFIRFVGENELEKLVGKLSQVIRGPTASASPFDAYNVEKQSAEVCKILHDKSMNVPSLWVDDEKISRSASLAAEEIRAMRHVLREAKSTRFYRRPLQVLLVEDDDLTRRVAGNVLKNDYTLITAKDAYEAVVNYLLYAPDVVFLDIDLPDQNGFTVLDQVISCDEDAFVVMFSSHDSLDNIVKSLTHGAHGFVTKPLHRGRLQHYLDCKSGVHDLEKNEN